MESIDVAMFPLESALLPGEDLPLRIFEPRYTALVRDCLDSPDPRFGVVLISRGREVGGGDARSDVGTLAAITDYVDAGGGRYALQCRMGERIKVLQWLPDDPYPRARVQIWPDEPGPPVTPAAFLDVEDRVLNCPVATRSSTTGTTTLTSQRCCTRWHLAFRWDRPTGTPCCRPHPPQTGWTPCSRRWIRFPRWWSFSCRSDKPGRHHVQKSFKGRAYLSLYVSVVKGVPAVGLKAYSSVDIRP
jgi:hypothetical protein